MKMITIRDKNGTRQIPSIEGEVLPPVRHVPTIIDPYVAGVPEPVQQTVVYTTNPIMRADAMLMKVHAVSLFLALLTGAVIYMLSLYPRDLEFLGFFMIWVMVASAEWIGTFIFIAHYDYKEQPAHQQENINDRYLSMMEKEQDARLRHLYPEQYENH